MGLHYMDCSLVSLITRGLPGLPRIVRRAHRLLTGTHTTHPSRSNVCIQVDPSCCLDGNTVAAHCQSQMEEVVKQLRLACHTCCLFCRSYTQAEDEGAGHSAGAAAAVPKVQGQQGQAGQAEEPKPAPGAAGHHKESSSCK